jgi:hypothetical protein
MRKTFGSGVPPEWPDPLLVQQTPVQLYVSCTAQHGAFEGCFLMRKTFGSGVPPEWPDPLLVQQTPVQLYAPCTRRVRVARY